MPSTYTTNLGIEKPATGEQSGTWGGTINTNYDMFDQAINGVASVTLTAVGTTGAPNTIVITDGAVSNGRNAFIEFDDGGDLGGDVYLQLDPSSAEKVVYIRNSLTTQDLYVFQGTYNAARDYVIASGKTACVMFSGAGDTTSTVKLVQADIQVDSITATGDLTTATNVVATGTVTGSNLSGTNTGDNAGVTAVTGGVGINSTGGTTPDMSLTVGELPEKTGAVVATDRLVGATGVSSWNETISGIPLSIFSNDLTNFGSNNLTTTGSITGDGITAGGSVYAENDLLTDDNLFGLIAFTNAIPGLIFDANDYIRYNRATDAYSFVIGGGGDSLTLSATLADFQSTDITTTGATSTGDLSTDGVHTFTPESGITAYAGGGQTNAILLTKSHSVVSTVASADDSVKLPSAAEGLQFVVVNTGANQLNVFPNTSDNMLNFAANIGLAQGVNTARIFYAIDATSWAYYGG